MRTQVSQEAAQAGDGARFHTVLAVLDSQLNNPLVLQAVVGVDAEAGEDLFGRQRISVVHGCDLRTAEYVLGGVLRLPVLKFQGCCGGGSEAERREITLPGRANRNVERKRRDQRPHHAQRSGGKEWLESVSLEKLRPSPPGFQRNVLWQDRWLFGLQGESSASGDVSTCQELSQGLDHAVAQRG